MDRRVRRYVRPAAMERLANGNLWEENASWIGETIHSAVTRSDIVACFEKLSCSRISSSGQKCDYPYPLQELKRKSNETPSRFVYAMQTIANHGYVAEEALIQYIIDGISND